MAIIKVKIESLLKDAMAKVLRKVWYTATTVKAYINRKKN